MTSQKWKSIRESRYYEALEMLPPACHTGYGFLLGEPTIHRKCAVTKEIAPAFAAFVEYQGRFFEATEAVTIKEFKTMVQAAEIAVHNGQ